MAHYGTLHDYKFADQGDDIRGALVYGANDEKLGKIDDVIFDHEDGLIKYVVVDTGGWLHSRRFIVPANVIHPYEKEEDHFAADLTKERIESFPAYDEKHMESPEAWERYERDYRKGWESEGSVMHQAGSDHNITPSASEMPASSGAGSLGAGITAADLTPRRIVSPTKLPGGPTTMPHLDEETATSRAVLPTHQSTSPSHIPTAGRGAQRWSSFQRSVRTSLPALRKRCTIHGCVIEHERKAS